MQHSQIRKVVGTVRLQLMERLVVIPAPQECFSHPRPPDNPPRKGVQKEEDLSNVSVFCSELQ